jgi:hypothetical protein
MIEHASGQQVLWFRLLASLEGKIKVGLTRLPEKPCPD